MYFVNTHQEHCAYSNILYLILYSNNSPRFRLRNFIFGFNWIEFTHDALIKYQAMTCDFTLLHVPFFRKAYLPNRADSGLVLLGDLLGCALTPVKDTATCGAKHP